MGIPAPFFMMTHDFTKTRKLTFSALIAASYFAVMFVTQGFAFGPIQIRIATALYALAYPFPFLVLPIGIANSVSNLALGGLGMPDVIGGLIAGIIGVGLVALVRVWKLPMILIILPIILVPGLMVPLWLSPLTGIPYWALVVNISLGQITPAIVGYVLLRALMKRKVVSI